VTTLLSASIAENASKRTQSVYEAVIERILEHTADTRSLFLRLPAGQRLVFKPGQFLSFFLPVTEQVLTRPYSIASDPENGNLLEICFNLVPGGLGSRYLFERRIGDTLRFTGPWGTFVLDQAPQSECIFIAEGPGIAPIRPMIKRALAAEDGGSVVRLLYKAEEEQEILYHAEWQSWAQSSERFHFVPLLSYPPAGWNGLRGSLLEQVERAYIQADSNRSRCFYICGVGSQVIALRDLLRQAGYQRRAVQYEKW
jgi:ferredoxin-NADP reductase